MEMNDINCMNLLANVGFAFCPADALEQIKSVLGITVLNAKGGAGAFREMCSFILYETH